MESLAQALAALSIADRLQVIEEAITTLRPADYPEAVLQLIEKQKILVAQE